MQMWLSTCPPKNEAKAEKRGKAKLFFYELFNDKISTCLKKFSHISAIFFRQNTRSIVFLREFSFKFANWRAPRRRELKTHLPSDDSSRPLFYIKGAWGYASTGDFLRPIRSNGPLRGDCRLSEKERNYLEKKAKHEWKLEGSTANQTQTQFL